MAWNCNLLFNHISIHPHGHCAVCCEADFNIHNSFARTDEQVVLIDDGINKVVNSDSFKDARLKMSKGIVPEPCTKCKAMEDSGGVSKRQFESQEEIDYTIEEDGSIKPNLSNIELRLGNYCNLKCRGCNAESSTSWIDDYNKLKKIVPLPSDYDYLKESGDGYSYEWTDDEKFYDDILANSPNLRMIQISGGEPFLVPKHGYLLERLIKADTAKHINLSYITNANYNFDKIKPTLDLLRDFKSIAMSVSIDDIGERNTFIRSLSNWKLTVKNLKRFNNEYNFYLGVTQTFCIFNFLTAEKLTQFLEQEVPGVHVNPNHVTHPSYLSANLLPKEVRQQKIDSIKGKVSDHVWSSLFDAYYHQDQVGELDTFLKVTGAIDKVRKESFLNTFPELYSILTKDAI